MGHAAPSPNSTIPAVPSPSETTGVVNAVVPTTGCGKTSPTPAGTTTEATLPSGGIKRMYRLHIPAGYDPSQKAPLVLNLAGHGETALQQERYTQYSALADSDHFFVVYPQGTIGPDGKLGWASYGKNDPTINRVQ